MSYRVIDFIDPQVIKKHTPPPVVEATLQFVQAEGLVVGMPETKIGDIIRSLNPGLEDPNDFSIITSANVQLLNVTEIHSIGVVANETFTISWIHTTLGTITTIEETLTAAT